MLKQNPQPILKDAATSRRLAVALGVGLLAAMPAAAEADALQVAVSITSQVPIVERIGGDHVQTALMVPPGSSPVTYEPGFEEMTAISEADVYFTMSLPFEAAWLPRLADAGADPLVVAMDRDLAKMPIGGHGAEGGGMADPHMWLSPPYMRIMAITVYETLAEHDPANAETYFDNYRKLALEINALDSEILATLDAMEAGSNLFMVFHPAWGYFARAYGMEQAAIEVEGGEPSPQELAALIDLAEARGVDVVFTAPQWSERAAQAIAESIDGVTVPLNPLDPDWFGSMRATAAAFSDALR